MEGGGGYQLREEAVRYISLFGAEKDDIATEKTYFWDVISRIYTVASARPRTRRQI